MKEEWLFQGAVVPVDVETTRALVAEIKRLIDVVGSMALNQRRKWVGLMEDEAMELALEIIARLDLPTTTKMQVEQQFIHALSNPNSLWMLFAAQIEAKLEEKNNG